mgnify:CR=1 FL=1
MFDNITKPMDEYLPALDTADSSWGTNWVYYYWFEKYEDKLIIHFELGGWNLTDELTKRNNAVTRQANCQQAGRAS